MGLKHDIRCIVGALVALCATAPGFVRGELHVAGDLLVNITTGGFVPMDAPEDVLFAFSNSTWLGFDLNNTSWGNATDAMAGNTTDVALGELIPSLDPYGMYCACECPPLPEPMAAPEMAIPAPDPSTTTAPEPSTTTAPTPSTTTAPTPTTTTTPAPSPTTAPTPSTTLAPTPLGTVAYAPTTAPLPPVCYCPCPAAPDMSRPMSDDELAAFCRKDTTMDERCAESTVADIKATVRYSWVISDADAECEAGRDRFGFCGDPTAVKTFGVICQKQAFNNETREVQVLLPFVDPTTDECTEVEQPDIRKRQFFCAKRDCEERVVRNRTVGACMSIQGTPDCGPKYQFVEKRCYSNTAKMFLDKVEDQANSDCANAAGESLMGSELSLCSDEPCPTEPFYQYTPFDLCDATCDDTTCPSSERKCIVAGTKTRGSNCVQNGSDGLEDATGCTADPEINRECRKSCLNAPLRFIKSESACDSTACDTAGTITITYTPCTSGQGCMRYPQIDQTNTVQTETVPCPGVSCDGCLLRPCVEENTISSSSDPTTGLCTCECATGFIGSRCQVDTETTYRVLDKTGMECESGVVDKARNCCAEGVAIDGCGYCEALEIADLQLTRVGYDLDGVCCSSDNADAFLTGDFTCCDSFDDLDECGVCGGSGDTCQKTLSGDITLTAGSTESDFSTLLKNSLPTSLQALLLIPGDVGHPDTSRRLRQTNEAVTYVMDPGSEYSTAEFAGAFIVTGMEASTAATPLLSVAPDAPDASTAGVAGDGVCGTGETSDNSPDDCVEIMACPEAVAFDEGFGDIFVGDPTLSCSNNGVCLLASGTCSCNIGYTGDACDQCDAEEGYVVVNTSDTEYACTAVASDFTGDGPAEGPSSDSNGPVDGPAEEAAKKGLGTGALIGIIVGAVGGVVIIAGGAFYVLRMRAGKEVSPV